MIIFNGQYPLKLLLWVWGGSNIIFLDSPTGRRQFGGNFLSTSGNFCHMFEIPATKQKPLQSSLFQIITRVSAYYRFVNPMGLKPMTSRTGIWRSIQLSYGSIPLYSRMFRTIVYDRQAIRITMQSYKDFIDFSHIGHDRPNIISVF